MPLTLSQKIGFVRCFGSVKQPKPNRFVVDLYFRKPLVVFAAYARKPTFVGARGSVPSIFHVADRLQIFPSVVRAFAVNVVNLFWRPVSCHIQPRQPVGQMQRVVDADDNVAVAHSASGFIPQTTTPPRFRPCKDARFRMVAHKFFKPFWRQIHLLVPLLGTININRVAVKGQV